MIYHPKIEFRGRNNYDERLVVSTFNPDSGETDSYLSMESVYTDSYDGSIRTDYGAKYNDVAKPSVTLIDVDGDDIPPFKVRSVLRWLTGSRQNAWMNIYNIDGELVCSYLGRFIDVKLQKMDARVIGIYAQFESISPWAYSEIQTVSMNINGENVKFNIQNDSDDIYSCIYPYMTFKNTNNGASFSIKNNTVGIETVFKNLQQNELVTIDKGFVVYSDNDKRIFNDDFNFIFPALSSGINEFQATGKGKLIVKFRYPMKVADGILNNYETKNSVSIYVDGTIAKIRGNVKKEPPLGINIKVDGTTIIIRGELKYVELARDESVVSVDGGIIEFNDNETVCPFDDFNADVEDGRLIIKKSLNDIGIKG